MAKFEATISADGNTYLCDVVKPRALTDWFATVHAIGTFGGGTITLGTSVDGGSTVVAIPSDQFELAASGAGNIDKLGNSDNLDGAIKLYAIMTGSTTPSVTVTVHDNR